MMNSILADLVRVNLAGAAAILVVLAARGPARRFLGPEMAYALWAAPPLVALATLMPAPVVDGVPPDDVLAIALKDWSGVALALWLVGVGVVIAALAYAQKAFVAAARAGKAGPAVVGVIAPRVYMPPDDGRYTPEERAVIRAHEHEHVLRADPRAGALASACRCCAGSTRSCTWGPTPCGWTRNWPATPPSCAAAPTTAPSTPGPC